MSLYQISRSVSRPGVPRRPAGPGGEPRALVLACFEQTSEADRFSASLRAALARACRPGGREIALERLSARHAPRAETLDLSYPTTLNGIVLTTLLRRAGVDTHVVTGTSFASFFADDDYAPHRRGDYTHILVSTTFIHSIGSARRILATLRQLYPEAQIVLGGPFLIGNPDVLSLEEVDVFCFGDGEGAAEAIVLGRAEGMPGVAYRRGGEVVYDRSFNTVDLDRTDLIDWDQFWECIDSSAQDRVRRHYMFPIETVRGCYFQCTFCNYANMSVGTRLKTAGRIVDEIRAVRAQGVRNVGIFDSTFTTPRQRVRDVCRALVAEGMDDLRFSSFGRVSDLDVETMQLMERAGWALVYLGLESGNADMVARMKKGYSKARMDAFFDSVDRAKVGLDFWTSFIVGYPGETERTLDDTYEFIRDHRLRYINIQPLQIRFNSDLFDHPDRHGLRFEPDPETKDVHYWRHETMDSEQAVDHAIDLFIRIDRDTDSLLLENLLNVSNLPRAFPPYGSPTNRELLRQVQRGMAIALREQRRELTPEQADEQLGAVWRRLFDEYVSLPEGAACAV